MIRNFLLTIRFHPLDFQIFEEAIQYIIPKIKELNNVTYSIEHDNTPDRHFHAVFEHAKSDADKCRNWVCDKFFKNLFAGTNTKLDTISVNVQMIQKDKHDLMKSTGYCWKELQDSDRKFTMLDDKTISEYVSYYYMSERNKQKDIQFTNKKMITPKNIWAYYQSEEQKLSLTPDDFYEKMLLNNYSFLNISTKQMKQFKHELKYIEEQNQENTINIRNHQNDENVQYDDEDKFKLIEFIQSNYGLFEHMDIQIPKDIKKIIEFGTPN